MRRLGVAFAIAAAVVILRPAPLAACSATPPTFDEAVTGASAIARVVVEDVTTYGEPAHGETFRVLRALKGGPDSVIHLDDPITGLCEDTIGSFAPEGTEAIVAFGIPFFGRVINAVWIEVDQLIDPLFGTAEFPESVTTLDELEAAILASMPDTALASTESSQLLVVIGSLLVIIGFSAAMWRGLVRSGDERPFPG